MGAGASSHPAQGIPGITLELPNSHDHSNHLSSTDLSSQHLYETGLGVPRKTNISRHNSSRRRREKDILRRDSSKRRADKPISIQVKNGDPGVDISNSKLVTISDDLFQRPDVTNIKWMDVSYNELVEIPAELNKIVCMTSLNFDNNFIADIGESLSNLVKLNKLILSNNRLKHFNANLLQIKNLTELSLSNNKLSELPENLGEFCNVVCLYVSHNTLKHLPHSIGRLRKLRVLDIRYNNIVSLPDSIEHLTALERLQAYCNELEQLPEGIGSCSRLKVLRISSNRLISLPLSLGGLVLLETLDVHNNRLTQIPECVCELDHLIELHIGDNQITYFNDNIRGLKRLQTLKANSNGLQCLPTFIDSLTNLKYLHIRNNNIRTLPDSMHELTKLNVFDAKNNPIHFPPREVWERGLSAIKAYFEEIKRSGQSRSSRLKITVLGTAGAGKTSFIHCLTNNCVPENLTPTIGINVSRWIPVEDPNMAFIIWDHSGNPMYDSSHQFFFSPGSLVFLVVNLAEYESCNEASYQSCVGKYVNMLRKFGGESVIQIIGTHADECDVNDVSKKCDEIIRHIQTDVNLITKDFDQRIKNAQDMVEQFSSYQKSHNHSEIQPYSSPSPLCPSACEEPVNDVVELIRKVKINQPKFLSNIPKVCGRNGSAGVKDFRRILFKLTQDKKRYPTVELFLPRSWLELEEGVKRLKKEAPVPVIHLVTFIEIAQKNDPLFKEKDIMEALLYLHMTGEVLHFAGVPGLRDYVFVSPVWLIDMIKCVINPSRKDTLQKSAHSTARMTKSELQRLWSNFSLNNDQYNLLQTVATAFGLWYSQEEGYVIPTLMLPAGLQDAVNNVTMIKDINPTECTQIQFHNLPSNQYQIIIKFIFPHGIPIGLFNRITVKCRRHCTTYTYHSTECFAAEKHDVSIVCVNTHSANDGNCLTVCTRAAKERLLAMWRMLLAFLNEIEELISQWQGLLFYRYLVCPHCFLADEPLPFHFLGEWYKSSMTRLPEIVKIACPVAMGAVRVHLKLLYPPKNAHMMPTPVSESEIQVVVSNISEHGTLLAQILGIHESLFPVDSSNSESQVTAMLQHWVEVHKENATSEELQNAVKKLNRIVHGSVDDGDTSEAKSEANSEPTETINMPTVVVNL